MHEGLVEKQAYKYWKKFSNQISRMLDIDDLISLGYCGLLKAIKRYNHSYNTEFSTYAIHWIDQSIRREIDNCTGIVRIPVHAIGKMRTALKSEENKDIKKYSKLKYRFIHGVSIDDILDDNKIQIRDSLIDGNKCFANSLKKLEEPETHLIYEDVHSRLVSGIKNYCK